jgi:L-fuconolactonase
MDACVAVQADETEEETNFLVDAASKNHFIKGVVGWVDLRSENINDRLSWYKQFPVIKGFRHVLQAREPSFMLQPDFLNGISLLKEYNYTYDILVFPKHLPAAIELVQKNPGQLFVVDHIAKPLIKDKVLEDWKTNIERLAAFENVYCKVSGMVTEAGYTTWKEPDFTPYLDIVVKAFGTGRIMFGSDWPVCLVAASYEKMLSVVENYFDSFSAAEKEDIFGMNAVKFYNL